MIKATCMGVGCKTICNKKHEWIGDIVTPEGSSLGFFRNDTYNWPIIEKGENMIRVRVLKGNEKHGPVFKWLHVESFGK